MHIFVTGATGYIGGVIVEKLIAAGHSVTGLARSPKSVSLLRGAGAGVAEGDLRQPESLAVPARACDGIIHAGFAWGPESGVVDRAAVEAMLTAIEGTRKPFLYTSGVWVMGDTRGRVAGEMFALQPPENVRWRPAVERLVLDAPERNIHGIVIRPAMVHGRGRGAVERFRSGSLAIIGDGENHWSFVHVDDLADLYVLALARSPAGELYLAADGPAIKMKDVAAAAGVEARWSYEEAREKLGPAASALVLDQKVGSTKAGRMLGWKPSRPSPC